MTWTNDDVRNGMFPDWSDFWVYDYEVGDYVARSDRHICGDTPIVAGTIETFLSNRFPRKQKSKIAFVAGTALLAASGLIYALFSSHQNKEHDEQHIQYAATKQVCPVPAQNKSQAVLIIEGIQDSIEKSSGPGIPSELVVEDDAVVLEGTIVQESVLEAMLKTGQAKASWSRIREERSYAVSDFQAVYGSIQSRVQAKREFIDALVATKRHDAKRVVLAFLRDSYEGQSQELFVEEGLSRMVYATINDHDIYFADDAFEILYPIKNGKRVPCGFAQSFTKEQKKAFGALLHQAYEYNMQIAVCQEQLDHMRRLGECKANGECTPEVESAMYEFFNDRVRAIEERYAANVRDVGAMTGVVLEQFSMRKSE